MMAERILGLDIGDQYIKAVAVNRTIRGNTQVDYCTSFKRTEQGDLSDDIKRLFEQHEVLRQLPCITALSVRDVSFRNLSFPFRDDRKIRQTMAFEVEPLLQYPITEAYLDYVPAKVTDETTILIAAVKKNIVRNYLDLLKDHVQDTKIIDIEGVSLLPFFLSHQHASGFNIILDIGAKHTVALFMREGKERLRKETSRTDRAVVQGSCLRTSCCSKNLLISSLRSPCSVLLKLVQ